MGIQILNLTNPDSLICKFEKVDGARVTVYTRIGTDPDRWGVPMQSLIQLVRPVVTSHPTEENLYFFHPDGGPRKNNSKYIHHVHVPGIMTTELALRMVQLGLMTHHVVDILEQRNFI
jgi:hypothetical protein